MAFDLISARDISALINGHAIWRRRVIRTPQMKQSIGARDSMFNNVVLTVNKCPPGEDVEPDEKVAGFARRRVIANITS